MSDEVQDEVAGQLFEDYDAGGPLPVMDVVDNIQDTDMSSSGSASRFAVEEQSTAPIIKSGGLTIAPVRMTSEVGEDGQKKVPGIKIIGLSSELKKDWGGEDSKDTSVEDEEEEDEDDNRPNTRSKGKPKTPTHDHNTRSKDKKQKKKKDPK